MSNYYERDKGIWYINGETTKVKCSYSGSLEVAFQMGKQEARKEIYEKSLKVESVAQSMARFFLNECEQSLKELHIINESLKESLDNRGKPSDELAM